MVTHAVKLGQAKDPFLQQTAAFRLKALAFTDQTRETLAREGGIEALVVRCYSPAGTTQTPGL